MKTQLNRIAHIVHKIFLAIGLLAIATTSVQAQTKVLFLGADPYNNFNAIKTDILGSDARFDFAGSSFFDASSGLLPTQAALSNYDSVLVWSDANFNAGISPLLENYLSAGGGVVIATFWGQESTVLNRWADLAGNPLKLGTFDAYSSSTLGAFNALDPLFNGVSTLSASTYRGDYLAGGLAPGAILAGSWADGRPLAAYNAAGNIVNITLDPNVVALHHASGDYAQLFRNGLVLAANGPGVTPVPEPSTYGIAGAVMMAAVVVVRRRKASALKS